jgi:CDP-diacylglycerol pyrophosphatase
MRIGFVFTLLTMLAAAAAQGYRSVLWIALQICVIAKRTTGHPYPCLSVDFGCGERPGAAILAEPGNPKHALLVPTRRIAGLEAPELQQESGTAYWQRALAARQRVVDAASGRIALEDVGLAVNSMGGRSQDQLHIHLSCVEVGVRDVLRTHGAQIGARWALVSAPLEQTRFFGMKISSVQAESFNPFAALTTLPGPHNDLRRMSLAAISTGPKERDRGFYILAYRSAESHAEKLLDHTCAIVQTGPIADADAQ